jgi:hypothetical protein
MEADIRTIFKAGLLRSKLFRIIARKSVFKSRS